MPLIINVFLRELRFILGNKSYLFLFLVWPLFDGLVLAGIYADKVVTRMPIAIVDNDHSALSRALVRYIDSSRSFTVTGHVSTVHDLEDLMYRRKIAIGVYIPRELERDVKRGASGVITSYIDGSNYLIANLAQADLRTMVSTIGAGMRLKYLQKTGNSRDKALAQVMPIKTDLTKLYNPGYNYVNYLAPGLWAAILQQVMMLFGALMIAGERDKKTFGELMSCAGNSAFAAAAGKIALYVTLSLALFEITFRVMFPLFDIPIKGSAPVMSAYTVLFILASISMGFLLSTAMKTRINAIKATLLISAPAFILCGYTWPISSMPAFIKPVAMAIPLTVYVSGYRKLYQQGAGAGAVINEALILAAMTAVFFTAGIWLMRRTIRNSVGQR